MKALVSVAAAKSLQLCPTLCNPTDGSPTGSPVPGILQARTLEWVAISFSSAGKWKVKGKLLSHIRLFATPWTAAHQAPPSMGFFQARVLEWGAIAFSVVSVRVSLMTHSHSLDAEDTRRVGIRAMPTGKWSSGGLPVWLLHHSCLYFFSKIQVLVSYRKAKQDTNNYLNCWEMKKGLSYNGFSWSHQICEHILGLEIIGWSQWYSPRSMDVISWQKSCVWAFFVYRFQTQPE